MSTNRNLHSPLLGAMVRRYPSPTSQMAMGRESNEDSQVFGEIAAIFLALNAFLHKFSAITLYSRSIIACS